MPFVPTPPEVALVNQIFFRGDTQKLNALTGDKAIGIFKAASLPEATLGDIWAIGDPENNGFLTRAGCAKVIRLIGWAQHGETNIGDHLLEQVGPLAVLEGYAPPTVQSSPVPRLPPQIATIAALPPLTPQDRQKFLGLFNGQGPVAGYLSGERARGLFIRSKLPVERLNIIWNLADRENRGSLDSTEFVIAMYFIQGSMGNPPPIPVLPSSLPPFLVDAAAGRPFQTGSALNSPTSPTLASTVSPQYTGNTHSTFRQQSTGAISPQMTGRPMSAAPSRIPPAIPARPMTMVAAPPAIPGQSPFPLARPPAHAQTAVVPWEIQPAEKVTSDGFFKGLDQQGLGYVEGASAVPFMLLSNLPDATLAKVWDLADMKNDGRLTEESFAVAMHLINQVLAGNTIPDILPVSLVPPSFRSELGMPPAVQQGPVVSETQRELFDIFDDPFPASAPVLPQPVQSQNTGLATFQSQYTGPSSVLSAFGTFPMPVPMPTPMPAPASQEPVKDLLGDDDEVIERMTHELSSTSAEIGNTQNQVDQNGAAYESTKTEREKLEAELAWKTATLSQLQAQLASAKAGYETESKLLATLKERYDAQLAEIQTTRTQLITAESDLSALKLEKTEVGGALLRDKEEVRELQRRHKEVFEELDDVKKEVEKAKKDVRLQKGLLAIAKKQLASAESDKAAAEKVLRETREEAETVEGELKEAERELAGRAQSPSLGAAPVPGPASDGVKTPSVRATSPVSSIRSAASPIPIPASTATLPFQDAPNINVGSPASFKSNNPFERLALSRSNSKSPFQAASPPPAPPAMMPNAEDDDPFGFNSLPSAATVTPGKTLSPENADGMGAATPGSDTTIDANVNHAPQASFVESDAYFTPPSTGTERMETQDAAVDGPLPQSQRLTEPGVPAPPVTTDPTDQVEESIDVNLPPLTEIKEASDSSDDSDEDLEDFAAARTAVKAEALPAPVTSPPPPTQPIAESPQQLQTPTPVPINTGAAAFDDLFRVSPATSNAATTGSDFSNISANPQQAPVAQNGGAFPIDKPFDSMTSVATPGPTTGATSAASVFDGLMGSGANAEGQPNGEPFKFDKTFDEPFDFNSFSTSDPPQASQAPRSATNGASAFPTTATPTSLSFDDAFGTSGISQDKGKQAQPLSFDDAFDVGSVVSDPQPQPVAQLLAQPQLSPAFPMPEPSPAPAATTIQAPTPRQYQESPSVTPPVITGSSSQAPVSIRSTSPSSTQQSTKERMQHAASPKPRSSGGSHFSGPAKASGSQSEPPPVKHSRFHLFSRSKTKKEKDKGGKDGKSRGGEFPPIPNLPARPGMGDQGDPPAADDLIVVKRLCGMGFGRQQAVEALEKHDYHFEAALNSLLPE